MSYFPEGSTYIDPPGKLRCALCPQEPGVYCHGTVDRTCCDRVRSGRPNAARFVLDRSFIAVHGTPPPPPVPPPPEVLGPPHEPDAGRARVGLLMPLANHGGAERWQQSLVANVAASQVVWQGCVIQNGPQAALPDVVSVFEARMPVGFGLQAARRLAARCDVLVVWAVNGLDRILAGLHPRPRVVGVCHAPGDPVWAHRLFREHDLYDRVVAVSELALDPIPKPLKERSTVIWNAVDTGRLVRTRSRAAMRRAWGVPVNARVVGYYGRISDEKDPYALERAVAALPHDWYGVAVGSSLWGQRGPSGDRVRWVGPDDRSGDVLSALDVHLVASHYESFGLSLAEGLWLGVPTVSTEVGIAKLVPYLTELVATDAPGPELARAVLDAQRNATRRVERSQVWARAVLDPRVFGQLWTKLLVREARQAAAGPVPRVWWGTPDQGKALKARVNRCSHRTPHGGCACDGWCDLNRGATVTDPATETRRSLVTLDDCLRCDLVPRT